MTAATAFVTLMQFYVLVVSESHTSIEPLHCPMEGIRCLEAAYLHMPPLDPGLYGGLAMNVPAMFGSSLVHVGLSLALVVMSAPRDIFLEYLIHCNPEPVIWDCIDIRIQPGGPDDRLTTVFLHVPDLVPENLLSPTGKGATR